MGVQGVGVVAAAMAISIFSLEDYSSTSGKGGENNESVINQIIKCTRVVIVIRLV